MAWGSLPALKNLFDMCFWSDMLWKPRRCAQMQEMSALHSFFGVDASYTKWVQKHINCCITEHLLFSWPWSELISDLPQTLRKFYLLIYCALCGCMTKTGTGHRVDLGFEDVPYCCHFGDNCFLAEMEDQDMASFSDEESFQEHNELQFAKLQSEVSGLKEELMISEKYKAELRQQFDKYQRVGSDSALGLEFMIGIILVILFKLSSNVSGTESKSIVGALSLMGHTTAALSVQCPFCEYIVSQVTYHGAIYHLALLTIRCGISVFTVGKKCQVNQTQEHALLARSWNSASKKLKSFVLASMLTA